MEEPTIGVVEKAAPVQTRRRGAVLEQAIRRSALAELAEVGYAALTMEAVAARAQTGKAALYRRWPTKYDLVVDAIQAALPNPEKFVSSGDLRSDLLYVLTTMNAILGGETALPDIAVIAELLRIPELREAIADQIIKRRLERVENILQEATKGVHAADDGQLALIARIGPALVLEAHFSGQTPITRNDLERVVDRVILPLLETSDVPGQPSNEAGSDQA